MAASGAKKRALVPLLAKGPTEAWVLLPPFPDQLKGAADGPRPVYSITIISGLVTFAKNVAVTLLTGLPESPMILGA